MFMYKNMIYRFLNLPDRLQETNFQMYAKIFD